MALYRTEAIVLRSLDYSEADKILTLYTKHFGKVRGLARGARRPRSRLLGSTQLFSHVNAGLFQGKGLDSLSQADIINSHRRIREDLGALARATYVGELTDLFTEERDVNERLFDLLLITLSALDGGNLKPTLLRCFEIKLMQATGFAPRIDRCVECESSVEGQARFSPSRGGVVCIRCTAEPGDLLISGPTLAALRGLSGMDAGRAMNAGISREMNQELKQAFSLYISRIIDRVPKSLSFLDLVGDERG
ncbi:MAG: DNA repair protein RecO [Bacillota bacterium]